MTPDTSLRVLSLKPGHDGTIALIEDGRLIFSLESEKDSFERYCEISPSLLMHAATLAEKTPDVIAIGGWEKGPSPRGHRFDIAAGYNGLESISFEAGRFFGAPVKVFSSSHERSHLFAAAALAPDAPLQECIILVWEGIIGAFYHWEEFGAKITRKHVLSQPGARYGALFALCDPTFPDSGSGPRHEDAGKLMALAAFGGDDEPTPDEREAVDGLLRPESFWPFDKAARRGSPLYNCGVNTPPAHRAARYLTNRLFDIFHEVAATLDAKNLPLLISGGCGLNCEWNTRWRNSQFFSEVFVPPCTNDSGSAIGTAMDALVQLGYPCKLEWSVYAGAPFRHNVTPDSAVWACQALDVSELALLLARGHLVAWVQGRCEIGPRALGHRSLLASPLTSHNKDVLNRVKGRDDYRPIAPVCLQSELNRWFVSPVADPYMLYFSKVRTDALPAVTHVDGTARVQSVMPNDGSRLHELLSAFGESTGYSVLCNTSLNFRGRGFINSMSDLLAYCDLTGIEDIVVDNLWYRRLYHP